MSAPTSPDEERRLKRDWRTRAIVASARAEHESSAELEAKGGSLGDADGSGPSTDEHDAREKDALADGRGGGDSGFRGLTQRLRGAGGGRPAWLGLYRLGMYGTST